MRHCTIVLALFALVLGMASAASAAALVYESFNYTGGENLIGKTADAGLNPWSGNGQCVSAAPGKTYTDGDGNSLPVNGNQLNCPGKSLESYATIKVDDWSANSKDGGKLNKKGATIWFSLIGQGIGEGQDSKYSRDSWTLEDTAGGGYFRIGDGGGFFEREWMMWADNDDADGELSATSTVNVHSEAFILGRLQTDATSADTVFDVWLNPLIDDESSLGTADMSITVGANDDGSVTQFNRLRYSDQKGEGPCSYDEIRMGETFNSVVGLAEPGGVIPEPSTLLIWALGLLGLLLYGRRRKR